MRMIKKRRLINVLNTRNIVIAIALIVGACFALTNAIPQDPAYHAFADNRSMLGIANFWNVTSNLAFLFVGAWGLVVTARLPPSSMRAAYRVFFAGLVVTAIGSSWYHLAPDNASLGWDRLTMTVAFAGLFAVVLGEYVSERLALAVLLVMLIAGPASVAYWLWTESASNGDLRPYALVQFLPLLIIVAILLLSPHKPGIGTALYALVALYVLSKLLEHYDVSVLTLVGVSGHSLKHVSAAIAALPLVHELRRRAQYERSP